LSLNLFGSSRLDETQHLGDPIAVRRHAYFPYTSLDPELPLLWGRAKSDFLRAICRALDLGPARLQIVPGQRFVIVVARRRKLEQSLGDLVAWVGQQKKPTRSPDAHGELTARGLVL